MAGETYRWVCRMAEDQDLVFKFFAVFSRFEYSLKRTSFLKKSTRAEPDWDAYANTLCGQFVAVTDAQFRVSCAYLKDEPPKQQVVAENQLLWRETAQGSRESEEQYILRLVRTVRNNLFHGGKYPYPFGLIDDVARNRGLLEASIVVLEQCLALSPAVRAVFCEAA